MDDYSCRLYLHTEQDLMELLEAIAKMLGAQTKRQTIMDDYLFFDLRRNTDFAPDLLGNEDGFLRYRYTAWVEPIDEVDDMREKANRETYLDLLMHVISGLRKAGVLVVASCGYEDLVSKRTGWNWSAKTPNHPALPLV